MISKNCLICKKNFKTWYSKIKKGQGKFCSRKCYKKWRIGENSPHYKHGMYKTDFYLNWSKHEG